MLRYLNHQDGAVRVLGNGAAKLVLDVPSQ